MRSQPMIVLTLTALMGGSAAALGGSVPADSGAGCAEVEYGGFLQTGFGRGGDSLPGSGSRPQIPGRGRAAFRSFWRPRTLDMPGVIAVLIQAGADLRAVRRRWRESTACRGSLQQRKSRRDRRPAGCRRQPAGPGPLVDPERHRLRWRLVPTPIPMSSTP